MKITLPKTIQICGRIFSMDRVKDKFGGEFSLSPQTIEWDAKHQDGADETMLHEIAEIILTYRRRRFHKSCCTDQGDLLFVFDHDGFEQFINDLLTSLKPYLNFRKSL